MLVSLTSEFCEGGLGEGDLDLTDGPEGLSLVLVGLGLRSSGLSSLKTESVISEGIVRGGVVCLGLTICGFGGTPGLADKVGFKGE